MQLRSFNRLQLQHTVVLPISELTTIISSDPSQLTHQNHVILHYIISEIIKYIHDYKTVILQISMFHRAFFNSIIDEYQHKHFFTFNTVLV